MSFNSFEELLGRNLRNAKVIRMPDKDQDVEEVLRVCKQKDEELILDIIEDEMALPLLSADFEAALRRLINNQQDRALIFIEKLGQGRLPGDDVVMLAGLADARHWQLPDFVKLVVAIHMRPNYSHQQLYLLLEMAVVAHPLWRCDEELFHLCILLDLRCLEFFDSPAFMGGNKSRKFWATLIDACCVQGCDWARKEQRPFYAYGSPQLFLNKNFLMKGAARVLDGASTYSMLPRYLQTDEEVAVAFCSLQSGILKQTGHLRENASVVEAAVRFDGCELVYASQQLQMSEDLLACALRSTGPDFMRQSSLGLRCADNAHIIQKVLKKTFTWSPLELLPLLADNLTRDFAVVGSIFEAAVGHKSMIAVSAEAWADDARVSRAWKSVPIECWLRSWPWLRDSPAILRADPRICLLLPNVISESPCLRLAVEAFGTIKWIEQTPECMKVRCGQQALLSMDIRSLLGTAFWRKLTWQEVLDIFKVVPTLEKIRDIVRRMQDEGKAYVTRFWMTPMLTQILETGEADVNWNEAQTFWDDCVGNLDNNYDGLIKVEEMLLHQPLCLKIAPVSKITDEIVVRLAEANPKNLQYLIRALPEICPRNEEEPPHRKRRRESRAARIARKVLFSIGAEHWDVLPQWLKESSGYEHFVCCICMTLPVCRVPEDTVRRCPGGHLICSYCLDRYLPTCHGAVLCPLCRVPSMVSGMYGHSDEYALNMLRQIA